MARLIQQSTSFMFMMALFLVAAATASAQQLKYDASEGGWVDKKSNLVWGYDAGYLQTAVPPGANGNGFPTVEPMDYPTAEYLAANYPEFLAANGWTDYATVAADWEARGLTWRLPTFSEVKHAYNQGLFSKFSYVDDDWPPLDGWFWTSSIDAAGNQHVIYHNGTVAVEAPSVPDGLPLFVRPYR
jgi:hypothetical protein